MGLDRAIGGMRKAGGPARVSRGHHTQAEFIATTHRLRPVADWTGADIAAFRRQLAEWQGWDPGVAGQSFENAMGAKMIEAYGGPRAAALFLLAACHGDQFGIQKPRKMSWLVGGEYRDQVLKRYDVLLDVAAFHLPGVTSAVRREPRRSGGLCGKREDQVERGA